MNKKIYSLMLGLLTLAGLLTGCKSDDDITFDHERQQFETRADRILLEFIAPFGTTANEEVYIIGPFNGNTLTPDEEGKYAEAIEAYTAALAYKENDAETSLEIVQAYIAMRDYAQAKAWLVRIAPYVESSNAKGRWLRSLGFIGIEELNYETAYALYAYSLSVEESPTAEQELQYIKYIYPSVKEFTAEEAYEYLKDLGIIPGE